MRTEGPEVGVTQGTESTYMVINHDSVTETRTTGREDRSCNRRILSKTGEPTDGLKIYFPSVKTFQRKSGEKGQRTEEHRGKGYPEQGRRH